LFQFGGLQNLDVVGKAQVEPADTFHLIDLGVEVPDVVVALNQNMVRGFGPTIGECFVLVFNKYR